MLQISCLFLGVQIISIILFSFISQCSHLAKLMNEALETLHYTFNLISDI